jgi:hypothetical protein
MRKGKSFESLDNAVDVFATSSGLTVHNTNIWYKQERQSGVSPIIHYIALSNLAWLKKPASAAKLNLHELIALCVAALRPSSATWRKFVIHLKKLEESGELSSDETTAIVASELTERMLVDVELTDDDDDASSLSEVIDRVKVTYKQQSEEEVVDAKRSAERIAAKERRLRSHVEGRARSVATRVSYVVALAVGLSFTVGTIISANDAASGQTPSVGVLVLAVFPLALGGLCSLFWGFHLRAWMNWLQLRLEQWATTWMTGSDGDG